MDRKDILIITLVVIVVGLVSFSFNSFVGKTVGGDVGMQDMTAIEIENEKVEQGEYVFATIYPGKRCVEKDLKITEGGDMAFSDRKNIEFTNTKSKTRYCEESVVYHLVGNEWTPGTYMIKAKDIETGEWVEATFSVVEG